MERFADWPQPWIALGIGSSEPWKQWGAACFAKLALALHRQQAGSVFIVGGPGERSLGDDILRQVRDRGGVAADAIALPLEQTAALLAHSRGYIGNDTGVLNMAAALQVPAIGLFGGSAPLWHSRFIHPLLPPAGEHGMAAITVSQVLEARARWSGPDVHHTLA
jgi:heptosyltransferase-2